MTNKRQILLLAPAAISLTCFVAAFATMFIVGTNRSMVDLGFAIAGYVAFAMALISSIAGIVIAIREGANRQWPWLVAHVVVFALALCAAFYWLGAHLV